MDFKDVGDGHLRPSTSEVVDALTSGWVAVDANVLLDIYRFNRGARDTLLDALESLEDRLFVPHQSAKEFYKNRLSAVSDRQKEIQNANGTLKAAFERTADSARHVFGRSGEEAQEIIKTLETAKVALLDALVKLKDDHGLTVEDCLTVDSWAARLESICEGKTGKPFSVEVEVELVEDFKKLIKTEQRTPGFSDINDKGEEAAAADYILWSQIKEEATQRQERPLIWVSNDTKKDWVLDYSGYKIGLHPNLIEELKDKANVRVFTMTVKSFLQMAGEHLHVDVTDETISQAEASGSDDIRNKVLRPNITTGDLSFLNSPWMAKHLQYLAEGPKISDMLSQEALRSLQSYDKAWKSAALEKMLSDLQSITQPWALTLDPDLAQGLEGSAGEDHLDEEEPDDQE